MSNFRVYVTVDVESSKGESKIKDVKSKLDTIPQKKKIHFDSNAQGLMANLRDLTVVLGGVVRGYQMVKRAADQVIAAQEKQIENEAKVKQQIEATGGAAGYQANQLIKLAAAWQQQYNIADEVILEAQAKLLSFRNIAGEEFTRTLMSAADVAIVMSDDVNQMTNTVVQLGKAINDPLTGLTMLTRTGITFSEQQKEQIRDLVENNQLLEAQQLILDELERQYGGQAKALAELETGPMKAYRLALGDLQERMGAVAQSILYDLVMNLKPLIENIDETKIKIGLLAGVAVGLIITINKLAKAIKALGVIFNISTGWIGATVTILGTLISSLILFTKTQRQANAERREEIKTMIGQTEQIINLAERYKELKDKSSLTKAEEVELKSVRDQLLEQHPELIRGTKDYEKALNGLKIELEALNEEQLMMSLIGERQELKDLQKDLKGAKKEFQNLMIEFERPGLFEHTPFAQLKADKLKETYDQILEMLSVDLSTLTEEQLNSFISGASEEMLIKVNDINQQLTDIQRGRIDATSEEKALLEDQLETYMEAYSTVKNIKDILKDTENTEKTIDEIIASQNKKKQDAKTLTEEQKQVLSPEDIAKYYDTVKFQDSEYFTWKKAQIQNEVEAMEISADQKRNLTNTLINDLIDQYVEFYNIVIEKSTLQLKIEPADPNNLKEVEDTTNEQIESLDLKPIPLPPHKPTSFEEDIQNLNSFFNTTGTIVSGIQDVWGQYYSYQSQLLQNQMNEEIRAVEQTGLSEQEKQAKIQNIREKYRQKELEMYAKMKPVKVAQAISNTALGVTKALSTYPPPISWIMAAAVAAAGAMEVATIEAQRYEKGTEQIKASDLINIPGIEIGREDGLVAVQRDEGIVSKEGTQFAFNRAMINMMNQGVDLSTLLKQFEMGTVLPSPDITLQSTRFDDRNITSLLRESVKNLKVINANLVEGKLLTIKVDGSKSNNLEASIRRQKRQERKMVEAGWHENMEID